jgi:hypothetical protein
MNAFVIIMPSVSAISSATGMIPVRYGGRGDTTLAEFSNVCLLHGLPDQRGGRPVYSLPKVSAKHTRSLYCTPFLLYAYSCILLGEKLTASALFGCALILVGLFLVIHSPT